MARCMYAMVVWFGSRARSRQGGVIDAASETGFASKSRPQSTTDSPFGLQAPERLLFARLGGVGCCRLGQAPVNGGQRFHLSPGIMKQQKMKRF